jgi:hypothetical protein
MHSSGQGTAFPEFLAVRISGSSSVEREEFGRKTKDFPETSQKRKKKTNSLNGLLHWHVEQKLVQIACIGLV